MLNSIKRTVQDYVTKVWMFTPNARFYLMNVILSGVAMGVFRLLFNFYALSLGFDEAFLGRLITISSLTSLLVALPMGYLADLLGRKPLSAWFWSPPKQPFTACRSSWGSHKAWQPSQWHPS
jgi:MFS family permease